MKPSLTAPQPCEARAEGQSGFEDGVPQLSLRGSVYPSHWSELPKGRKHALVTSGFLVLDPGPGGLQDLGQRLLNPVEYLEPGRRPRCMLRFPPCLRIEGLSDTLGQVPEGSGLF